MKPIEFTGTSLDDLRGFPLDARRDAGYQLDRIQQGLDPADWKYMTTIGAGVREIRIREADGAFRIIYIAKFEEAVYVLHCFRKKAQKTAKTDIQIAAERYKHVLREREK